MFGTTRFGMTFSWLCYSSLFATVLVLIDPAAAMAEAEPAEPLIIENEFLRAGAAPDRDFGTLRHFIYKPTERELSNVEMNDVDGAATLRSGLGRRLWRDDEAGEFHADAQTEDDGTQVLETAFRWTGEQHDVHYDFRFEQRYTLRPGESRLQVDWTIHNLGEERRPVSPWLHNIMLHRGDYWTLLPEGHGTGDRPRGNSFFEPVTNWMANTAEQTFYTVVELDKAHEYYMWREHGGATVTRYTLETIFQQDYIDPGESWQTTFFMAVAPELPNVAFASPEAAVAMEPLRVEEPGSAQIELTIAPVRSLGEVRLEGELTRDGESVMPLAPRHIEWEAGETERISYSIQPPEPGAYLIELNVYQNGEQYALGHEVGAHRRYIETPLVVGELPEDAVAMEPWPRERMEVRPIEGRELDLPLVGANDVMRIGLAHPAQRVFREDGLATSTAEPEPVRKSLARSEWESIPLVVFPERDEGVSGAWVSVSPLVNEQADATIEPDRFRIYRVGHILTTYASRFQDFPVGHYPDPLLPLEVPIDLSGSYNTTFWVNVQAPRDAPAGEYEGTIRVHTHQGDVEVPLRVRVWDFALPSPSALKTWAGSVAFGGGISRQMAALGIEDYDSDKIREDFVRYCLDYGFSPGHGARYSLEQVLEWQDHNRGFSVLPNLSRYHRDRWATPETIAEHGWEDKAYVYAPFDEHSDDAVPEVAEWAEDFREQNPHVQVLNVYYGSNTEPLHGLVDAWCRNFQRDQWTRSRMDEGDEFWRVNAPLIWGVESELAPGRRDYWQMWSHGYTGQLLWSVAAWRGKDPPDFRGLGRNALALNMYPIPNGLTTTIRWENMRDGLEDYDYFHLLKQYTLELEEAGGSSELTERARAIWDDPDLHERVGDWQEMKEFRLELGDLIEELNRSR